MRSFPIVERELLVALRRPFRTWGVRAAGAAVGTVVCGWLFLLHTLGGGRFDGTTTFEFLRHLLFFALIGSGIFLTADTLSEERREGTLGLLFLSNLRGYDVVLGKLAARSLNLLFALLGSLPLLGLPILAGGVTGGEFWRTALVLFTALLFSQCAGLLVSSVCREKTAAMAGTALLLLASGTAGPLLWMLLRAIRRGAGEPAPLWIFSPLATLDLADDESFRINLQAAHFLVSWLCLVAAALVFFAAAAFLVRRRGGEPVRPAATRRQRPRMAGQGGPLAGVGAPASEMATALWPALASTRPARGCGATLAIITGVWLIAFLLERGAQPRVLDEVPALFFVAWLLCLAVKVWMAGTICQRVVQEQRAGWFELVLTTPVEPMTALRVHAALAGRQFATPTLAAIAVSLVLLLIALAGLDEWRWGFACVAAWVLLIVTLCVDLPTLVWAGIRSALSRRVAPNAIVVTLAAGLVWPGAAGVAAGYGMLAAGGIAIMVMRAEDWFPVVVVLILAAAAAAMVGVAMVTRRQAERQLERDLRRLAAEEPLRLAVHSPRIPPLLPRRPPPVVAGSAPMRTLHPMPPPP